MPSEFNYAQQPGHGTYLYDDIANAIAFQGGGFNVYQTNDGLPQGGLQINLDQSTSAISPSIDLGAFGNKLFKTTPPYVWIFLAIALLGLYLHTNKGNE